MARQSGLNATRGDWSDFARWCVARGETAMPAAPSSVVEYIQDLAASNEAATVPRRVAAIRDWHRASGLQTPTEDDRVRLALTARSGTVEGHPSTQCRSTPPSSPQSSPRLPAA